MPLSARAETGANALVPRVAGGRRAPETTQCAACEPPEQASRARGVSIRSARRRPRWCLRSAHAERTAPAAGRSRSAAVVVQGRAVADELALLVRSPLDLRHGRHDAVVIGYAVHHVDVRLEEREILDEIQSFGYGRPMEVRRGVVPWESMKRSDLIAPNIDDCAAG